MERLMNVDPMILNRCNQKYYDKVLSKYDISYTQMFILMAIYEHKGLSMNELAVIGAYDKGTITKAIQKLEQLNYVEMTLSSEDKRLKLLNTTPKCDHIMPELYMIRQGWQDYLFKDISREDYLTYVSVVERLNNKAKEYPHYENDLNIHIYGLQKLTLLDYPGKMAATLFTGGCNFRCPFCHNRSLVFLNEQEGEIDQKLIFEYLEKRKNVLDGVCISGGEPLLQEGIKDLCRQIKDLGLMVKLDTNGYCFDLLKELVEESLVDYVAMDIKNTKDKYSFTCGLNDMDLSGIEKSVEYLKSNVVDYEFRTTIVKEFHEDLDLESLGKWLKGAKRYYLQNFEDRESCIQEGLSSLDIETIKNYQSELSEYIENVYIRGLQED